MTESNSLSKILISQLENDFKNDRCICVVGPGALKHDVTNDYFLRSITTKAISEIQRNVNSESVKNKLAEYCGNKKIDYFLLATYVDSIISTNGLRLSFETHYDEVKEDYLNNSKILDAIAQIPSSYFINCGFDDVLLEAMRQKGRDPFFIPYRQLSEGDLPINDFSPERPIIFNLYGYYRYDDFVSNEIKLHRCMASLLSTDTALPSDISFKLNEQMTRYMFLGVRFHRWYNRMLLGLFFKNKINPEFNESVAYETEGFFNGIENQLEISMLCGNNDVRTNIHLFNLKEQKDSFLKIMSNLNQQHSKNTFTNDSRSKTKQSQTEIAIFLSYRHQVLHYAIDLANDLIKNGIHVCADSNLVSNISDMKHMLTASVYGDWKKDFKKLNQKIYYHILLLDDSVFSEPNSVIKELSMSINEGFQDSVAWSKEFYVPVRVPGCNRIFEGFDDTIHYDMYSEPLQLRIKKMKDVLT